MRRREEEELEHQVDRLEERVDYLDALVIYLFEQLTPPTVGPAVSVHFTATPL